MHVNDDMILDMDAFDFASIEDDAPSYEGYKEPSVNYDDIDSDDADDDVEEFDYEDEDVEDTDADDAEDLDESGINSMKDFADNFETLPDDLEFKLGDESFSKADVVDTLRTRKELMETQEAMGSYISSLNEINSRINGYLKQSASETELKLIEVNQRLANPENMAASDVQRAVVLKRELEQRQKVLENNIIQAQKDEQEKREIVNVHKINSTDLALRGSEGYKGIQTIGEIARWAQGEGIDPNALMDGMSPALVRALMDAKAYRERKVASKERLANTVKSAPKSVKSDTKASAPKKTSKAGARQRAEKAIAAGKGNPVDFFHLLED